MAKVAPTTTHDVFLDAKASFLSSLPPEEQRRFKSCISAEVLILELQGLDLSARKRQVGKRWLQVVERLAERLNPYFDIIGIFVSSNPEYAALVWGSLRVILKVAVDYHSFFDKLTSMLSSLAEALPDYGDLLKLCVEKNISDDDEANPRRMRNHIEEIYVDIFNIFRIVARLFLKSNGKARNPAAVAGSIIWTPFEGRFGNVLKRMQEHRTFVLTQLTIWHASQTSQEIARAAAERDISVIEREDAAKERELMEKERAASAESRRLIHAQIRAFERERKEHAVWRLQNWISPPSGFATKYQNSLKQRTAGTARWLFDQKAYTRWLSDDADDDNDNDDNNDNSKNRVTASKRRFGSNTLWVQGNPGAGKTVLAATVVEELLATRERSVYYYFFDYKLSDSCGPSAALRAILSQLLSTRREDLDLLDRMTFAAYNQEQRQLTATDADVMEVLRLCLDEDAILVLDGIDECSDSEHLIETLVTLANQLPAMRSILFSRVYVPALKVAVPARQVFNMPKSKLSPDIRRFLVDKLDHMIEDEVLPASCADYRDDLADRLCRGADGMFLWARLMTRCLQFSGDLTRDERLEMIRRVQDPEGLEAMYERIVSVIQGSGRRASGLASRVLAWLAFSVTPLTSRQLREAINTQGNNSSSTAAVSTSDDTSEFEEAAIMACAGLIERSKVSPNPESPRGEPCLRFIHLSLQQLMRGESTTGEALSPFPERPPPRSLLLHAESLPRNAPGIDGSYLDGLQTGPPLVFQSLVASPGTANLALASVCLHQLLYHSPAQPLGGAFDRRVLEDELNREHCFLSYAAAQWLVHLERCLLKMEDDIDGADHPPSSSLVELVKLISTFLGQPRVLSAWLEAYYISNHQREAAGNAHPPAGTLCRWLDFVSESILPTRKGHGMRVAKLIESVRELSQALVIDLDKIKRTWGDEAFQAPELVWDEMAYFAGTELFFDPKSIKISVQEPEAPSSKSWPGISATPIAKMSRASPSNYAKGLLYIWGPREIHNSSTFTEIRVACRHKPSDIRALCTGWVATYHIWKLGSDSPVAGIELALEPEEIYHPLRKFLDEPLSGGIDFPLAISADALSFCVLRTVYAIQPGAAGDDAASSSKIWSQKLHVASPYEHDFVWTAPGWTAFASSYYYDLHFSPSTRFLALLESNRDGTTCISVFQCLLDPVSGLVVKPLDRIALSAHIQKVEHPVLHDRHCLLAFCGTMAFEDHRREKCVFIWDFGTGAQRKLIRRGLANYWSAKSISFSSCGTHLVVQPDFPANAQPVVIPCPEGSSSPLLGGDDNNKIQGPNLILNQLETQQQSHDTTTPLLQPTSSFSKAIIADAAQHNLRPSSGLQGFDSGREPSSHQHTHTRTTTAFSMPSTQVVQVSPSYTSRAEVALTHQTDDPNGNDALQTTKILSLPAAAASSTHFSHAAVGPQTAADTYKISLDVQPRRHYPLHNRDELGAGDVESRPVVIERHPAFVSTTTTTTPRITGGPARILGAVPSHVDAENGWRPVSAALTPLGGNDRGRILLGDTPMAEEDASKPRSENYGTSSPTSTSKGGGANKGGIVRAVLGAPSAVVAWLWARAW